MDAAASGAARGNGFHFPISTGDARMEEPAFRSLRRIVRSDLRGWSVPRMADVEYSAGREMYGPVLIRACLHFEILPLMVSAGSVI